jgi:muconate cycloisomerase
MTRIQSIEVFGVEVPLAGPGFKNAYITKRSQKSAVVRIRTMDGQVGLGNVDPSPGYSTETIDQTLTALAETLAPAAMGQDAANIQLLMGRLDQSLLGFLDAKAAIEMACMDLLGQRTGLSVATLLGGAVRTEFRFNAWIGIVSPEEAAAEALRWQALGWRSTKIKVGGGIEADAERVRAVRQAVGEDFQIRVDANAGYSVDDAIALGRLLDPYGLELMEQPVAAEDLEGLSLVKRSVGMPVMADEAVTDHASLLRIIRAEAADLVKLKVMKQGGFLKTARMLATAEAAGLRVVIGHGFGLGVNTMAEILFASTSHAVIDGLECVGPIKTTDDIVTEKLDLQSGRLTVPTAAGIGVSLDEERLARYAFSQRMIATP